MQDSYNIPLSVFKKVLVNADAMRYDINVGAALCFYDSNTNILNSPLCSEEIRVDSLSEIIFNPVAGTYLIKYDNADTGKKFKRTITIRKRITTSILKDISNKYSNEYVVNLLIREGVRKSIFFNDKPVTVNKEKGYIRFKDTGKLIKFKKIKDAIYYPETNKLILYTEAGDKYKVNIMLDCTGNILK